MNKIKVEMGAVPETMLQTMYARARESQKPDAKKLSGRGEI